MTDQATQSSKPKVLPWVVAFFAAMIAAVWASETFDLGGFWSAILMLLAMLVLIPMVSAAPGGSTAIT